MELGKGKLLRTGLNALYQAVHPVHGLVWTDGNQVVLTDVQLQSGEAKFGDSEVIGQFEHVCAVSWAPPGAADTPPLLAVQHTQHVTVWQLCPSTMGTSKWLMSETCEIRESLPVLPQGCVWHPQSAVLTVLTSQDVSVFHNVCCDSSRVKVDSSAQGLVHCACWTPDGQRLVVAAGSSLHSYIWDSAQKTLRRGSSSSVLGVDSSLRSISAAGDSQVAVATELPLGQICGLNASEALGGPPHGEDACVIDDTVVDDVLSVDKGAIPSETNSDTSGSPFSPSLSGPLDLTHIIFNRSKSEDTHHPNRGLSLTADSRSPRGRPGSALIEEIRSPPSSVGDGSVALGTPDTQPAGQFVTLPRPRSTPDHTSTPAPLNFPQRKTQQREEETYQPSKELEILSRKLVEVQQCLSELTDFLRNGKKYSPVYPLSRDLPYVHISYQKPYSVGPVVETRDMLLCNGKLRLSTIQQTFGLSLIEMLHGSRWILVSADSEGFIPLTFTAAQEIIIRDGGSRSNIFRDSLSQSLDSGPCLGVCRDLRAQSLDTTGYSDRLGSTA
ncbi:WD repeat and coiled-coil-containing protein isoform X5 [Artibeus jamaicensis]|uniref:WD repeat and coiled-coil-containing protein isoform X5 n=1 Tax=Artibeus jamaicensis TaxID=9417 RepID=UPI00235A7EF7|nr:WD repeat and coiled-coil-containing protein isoform X5 [Artibeus jamaicensis]